VNHEQQGQASVKQVIKRAMSGKTSRKVRGKGRGGKEEEEASSSSGQLSPLCFASTAVVGVFLSLPVADLLRCQIVCSTMKIELEKQVFREIARRLKHTHYSSPHVHLGELEVVASAARRRTRAVEESVGTQLLQLASQRVIVFPSNETSLLGFQGFLDDDESVTWEIAPKLKDNSFDDVLWLNGEIFTFRRDTKMGIKVGRTDPSSKLSFVLKKTFDLRDGTSSSSFSSSSSSSSAASTAIFHSQTASLSGSIYLTGGYKDGGGQYPASDRVFVFKEHPSKPELATFVEQKAKLVIARVDHATIEFDDKLFAAGGSTGYWGHGALHRSVEVFDPLVGTWKLDSEMVKSASTTSLFVVNGELYAMCFQYMWASESLTTMQKRDNLTREWSIVVERADIHLHRPTFVLGSKVYFYATQHVPATTAAARPTYQRKWFVFDVPSKSFEEPTEAISVHFPEASRILVTSRKAITWANDISIEA